MVVMLYYLPLWFQAVKGVTALKSGLMLLPTILSVVITTIGSGFVISKVGYSTPFFIIASIIMPVELASYQPSLQPLAMPSGLAIRSSLALDWALAHSSN